MNSDLRAPAASHQKPPYEVSVAFAFSDEERDVMVERLNVRNSPYVDHGAFVREVRQRAAHGTLDFFREACDELKRIDPLEAPVLYLKNCPIDRVLPIFDFDDPVKSKYEQKRSFVAEAFLQLFADWLGMTALGYRTVNNGDVFHDVYPMRHLQETQSQKTMTNINFHNDLPNNYVRPDWVNILAMRNPAENEVFTVFVRNKDLFQYLSPDVLETLRKPLFFTPHEVIHQHGGRDDDAPTNKPILLDDGNKTYLGFFENRTDSTSPEGRDAIRELINALHVLKCRLFLEDRDLIAVNNNTSIHGRDLGLIRDAAAHRIRWLLKTWNVDDLEPHRRWLVPDRPQVVNE